MNRNGLLIAIEGIDGSGKSSLARALHTHLQISYPTLLTKEPGDSSLGKEIRKLVQEQTIPVCAKAEYLLFAADRAQHFQEVVLPALQKGMIVLSDRLADSSLVYQGYARGLDMHMLKAVNEWAMQGRNPDITIFVQVDPNIAQKRLISRNEALTAFEKEQESFMQKVNDGFCALYQNRTDVILINGACDQETVLRQTVTALTKRLSTYETP
jgi:dTMP kinase